MPTSYTVLDKLSAEYFLKIILTAFVNRCSINSLWMIKSGYVYFSINIITCVLSLLTTSSRILKSLLLAPALSKKSAQVFYQITHSWFSIVTIHRLWHLLHIFIFYICFLLYLVQWAYCHKLIPFLPPVFNSTKPLYSFTL